MKYFYYLKSSLCTKNSIMKNSSTHLVEEKKDSRYTSTHFFHLDSEPSLIVVVKSPNFGTRFSGVKMLSNSSSCDSVKSFSAFMPPFLYL